MPAPVYPEIIDLAGVNEVDEALKKAVLHAYDIRRDCEALAAAPGEFEALRCGYWVRREFSAYTVINAPAGAVDGLKKLDFRIG